MSLVLDALLALLALAAALRVILARDAVSAVIAFVAFGLVLGLVWVRLAAVDVALTEVAVGSGITGLVLLRAAARRPARAEPDASIAVKAGAAVLALLVSGALAAVVLLLPEPAPSLAPEVAAHLPASGLGNPVTGVLIVYRALDTLLETVVLLLALIGVWSLSPDRFWKGAPAPLWPAAPSGALSFLARILAPVGILVGAYLFWAGADVPGGAFQGGAVLAAVWLLLILSGVRPAPEAGRRALRALLLLGPGAFLLAGIAGWFWAGAFLDYPAGFEKPVIVVVEAAITLSIAVTLGLMVLGPPEPRRAP